MLTVAASKIINTIHIVVKCLEFILTSATKLSGKVWWNLVYQWQNTRVIFFFNIILVITTIAMLLISAYLHVLCLYTVHSMEHVVRVDYLYGFIAFSVCPDLPQQQQAHTTSNGKLCFCTCQTSIGLCAQIQMWPCTSSSYQGVLISKVSWYTT